MVKYCTLLATHVGIASGLAGFGPVGGLAGVPGLDSGAPTFAVAGLG